MWACFKSKTRNVTFYAPTEYDEALMKKLFHNYITKVCGRDAQSAKSEPHMAHSSEK